MKETMLESNRKIKVEKSNEEPLTLFGQGDLQHEGSRRDYGSTFVFFLTGIVLVILFSKPFFGVSAAGNHHRADTAETKSGGGAVHAVSASRSDSFLQSKETK